MSFLSQNGKTVMAAASLMGTRAKRHRRSVKIKSVVQGAGRGAHNKDDAGHGSLAGASRFPLNEAEIPRGKRALDITLVVAGMFVWVPLSLLVILWIKAVSSGPVLFKQTRVGLGEKKFTIFKFRSMKNGTESLVHEQHVKRLVQENAPLVKLDALGDPRVIPGGRFLRATGLDELPQLLNVLRGEMSFVGPRPCLPQEHSLFTESQKRRFQVLPGLTGLWQINRRHAMTFKRMNVMDVFYARRISPGLDLLIILKTPPALVRQMLECLNFGKGKRKQGKTANQASDGRGL